MANCRCPICGKFIPGVFGFCSDRCYRKRFERMGLLEQKIRQAKKYGASRRVSWLCSVLRDFQADVRAGVKERK